MEWASRLVVLVAILVSVPSLALNTTPAEQARAERWAAAKFSTQMQPLPDRSYLAPDRDGMERNEHLGRPLRIGSVDYPGGLFMGRTSSVTVHLAAPAERLVATVGLDGRSYGCGYTNQKQQFSVRIGSEIVAQSPVVEVGQPGLPLQSQLHGATDFTLLDNAPGEQNWCQEAVWANAQILLRNGSTVSLGDLPVGPGGDAADAAPPFSFIYDGQPSAQFLSGWHRASTSHPLDRNRTRYDIVYTDPQSRLTVTLTGIAWHDFPVVEWTLYFQNDGDTPTSILENISAIDTNFQTTAGAPSALHHFRGSPASPTDFEPFLTGLTRQENTIHIATSGGRPTDASMCYFNLDDAGQGIIMGLGWPGQWAADFTRDADRDVRMRAGQELTHFRLLPHERVRTPLVALLFWNGNDWLRGQNLWRSWMLADNLPRFSNGTIQPHLAASSAPWFGEMVQATEDNQKLFLDRYRQIGIRPDFWWMDAGWYVNNGTWPNTGTWTIDPKRFPHGLRPVTDYAHAMGLQTIVWFELERVTRGSELWDDHPDWLLRATNEEKHGQRLLNLGNPDAEKWVVHYLDRFITEQGVDVYRIDFNIAPLDFWRQHDAPDRQGITEIRYVTGFLDYLDQLRKLHPRLVIDTCASGGRRDDLETLRRAVPMHRSDYGGEPTGSQNIGYGLAFWVPYYGAPNIPRDNYVFRSSWSPQMNLGWDVRRPDLDYSWMRRAIEQWRSVAPDFLGDYYPLLPYDPSESGWMAWQFDRPDLGTGLVQAFRRAQSSVSSVRLQLHHLDPRARYALTDLDSRVTRSYPGSELQTSGVEVSMPDPGSSRVLSYVRQPASPSPSSAPRPHMRN